MAQFIYNLLNWLHLKFKEFTQIEEIDIGCLIKELTEDMSRDGKFQQISNVSNGKEKKTTKPKVKKPRRQTVAQSLLKRSRNSLQNQTTGNAENLSDSTATNSIKMIKKATPHCFENSNPSEGEENYLYAIDFNAAEKSQNVKYDQKKSPHQLGILTRKRFPKVNTFSLFTEVGGIDVSLREVPCPLLNWIAVADCKIFQFRLTEDIFRLKTNDVEFDVNSDSFYVVPIDIVSQEIDFALLKNVNEFNTSRAMFDRSLELRMKRIPKQKINPENVKDKVVFQVPYPFVYFVEKLSNVTPNSPFFDSSFNKYKDYFRAMYGMNVVNDSQPLLKVTRQSSVPASVLIKTKNVVAESKQLVPEFCIFHPYPASLWRQTFWLPSVLHRLSQLFQAEDLRSIICTEAGILDNLPTELNWDLSHDYPFNIKNSEGICRFDDSNFKQFEGKSPTPTHILQALTTESSDSEFNLERLEFLGDSFLNLATSIYVYCKGLHCQGTMHRLRQTQITNKTLRLDGQKKNIHQMMSNESFVPVENWLPPSFRTINDTNFNQKTMTILEDKDIADGVEALIGTYLTCGGIKSALKVMKWIGIVRIPEAAEDDSSFSIEVPNPLLVDEENMEDNNALKNLVEDLGELEGKLNYKFNNVYYLLQALIINGNNKLITNNKESLKFLGNAVLEYIMKRILYEDKKCHNPDQLTKLHANFQNGDNLFNIANRFEIHRFFKFCPANVKGEEVHKTYKKLNSEVLKAIAGAIFLDSNLSLDIVWRVLFQPLLESKKTVGN